jgi:prepilin-type N-terminal cleavage/methylation domain-containing protein
MTAGLRARTGGFTLIEMLITLSLMLLTAGAVMASVAGGFRLWQRASSYNISEQAALLAFEGLRKDLHSAAPFALVPFSGVYDELSFAMVSGDRTRPKAPDQLGRHGYYLNGHHHVLCRSFVPFPQAGEVRLKDRCEVVLEDVQRLRFDYYGTKDTGGTGEPGWSESWEEAHAPDAVKISVTIQEGRRPSGSYSTVLGLLPAGKVQDDKES